MNPEAYPSLLDAARVPDGCESATRPAAVKRHGRPDVSLVVASIDSEATIAASLDRFLEELGESGELILVDASRGGTVAEFARADPRVRLLRRPPGSLAPELWRDGLRVARGDLVAFSTAQMVPAVGWLGALRGRLESSGAVAVGGPIDPAPGLSASGRALYLLRYVHYLRPLPVASRSEPPGDNAIYRRAALLDVVGTWSAGFWEVEVHRALRARGSRLALDGEGAVEFHGGGRFRDHVRQRGGHARHYGAARGGRMGTLRRLAGTVAAPMVPAILLRRIAATLTRRGRGVAPWLPALPGLTLLLAAWSVGEAVGTWLGPPRGAGASEIDGSPDRLN